MVPVSAKIALDVLSNMQEQVINHSGRGPRDSLKELKRQLATSPGAREVWRKKARLAAVLGSCPSSHQSLKSGIKHWIEYIEITHGREVAEMTAWPPQLEDILGWSNTFR